MQSVCISQTELPGASALYKDFLYRFDRVSRFYAHDPHDLEALRRFALQVSIPDARRQALVQALRKINGDSASLDALELPETVAVVTGQQVGLFGGPAYSVYKALTAARIARELTERGVRAVPVFWLATEDHDFAEVRDAWVFDSAHQPVRLSAQAEVGPLQPVGGARILQAPIAELRQALRGTLYEDEVVSLVEECYQPGRTFGESFRLFFQRVLAGCGLIFFDPMQPEVRALAAPFLQSAAEQAVELSGRVLARNAELEKAGYHAQVHFEKETSLFFRLQGGQRLQLKRSGDGYWLGKEQVEAAELIGDPASLSPNALLRPVMQDYLLPSAAYVGGPAELAYLAQSQVIYEQLLGRMPVAIPRTGFTLLDERSNKLMARFGLRLPDTFHGQEPLQARIGARLIPDSLDGAFEDAAGEIRNQLDRLEGELRRFDITLAAALQKSRAKIVYQISKNRAKAAREALRREQRVRDSAAQLSGLVFPERHLQERLYSILPFLARHGFDLIDTLYGNVHSGCPDHHMLTL
jgi:bacillithiol biosynthesis cysteine-adding enzyme BshC